MKAKKKLKEEIWERYGSFELSHHKNQAIVENILEFILKEKEHYLKSQIKTILSDYTDKIVENVTTTIEETYAGSLGNENGELYDKVIVVDKESITNQLKLYIDKLNLEL